MPWIETSTLLSTGRGECAPAFQGELHTSGKDAGLLRDMGDGYAGALPFTENGATALGFTMLRRFSCDLVRVLSAEPAHRVAGAVGSGEKFAACAGERYVGQQPESLVALWKRPLLFDGDPCAHVARAELPVLLGPQGARGLQRSGNGRAGAGKGMAPDAQRRADAADGYRGKQQVRMVAVSAGTCLAHEDRYACGRAAQWLPRLRGQHQTQTA